MAVIDEVMARKYWPKGNPIGAKLRRGPEKTDPLCTIVGIVGSVKTGQPGRAESGGPGLLQLQAICSRDMHVVVKAARDDVRN